MQQLLKPAFRSAWARIVAAELLEQLLRAVDEPMTALHAGFRRETPATLASDLETEIGRGAWLSASWDTSGRESPGFGAADYTDAPIRAPSPN
jgi:hypothetical protein